MAMGLLLVRYPRLRPSFFMESRKSLFFPDSNLIKAGKCYSSVQNLMVSFFVYRDGLKVEPVLLSNSQAGPGRNFSQPRARLIAHLFILRIVNRPTPRCGITRRRRRSRSARPRPQTTARRLLRRGAQAENVRRGGSRCCSVEDSPNLCDFGSFAHNINQSINLFF